MTDALGRVTRYGRDAEGGLTSVEGADGTVETMRLDPAGRVTAMTDGAGNVTEYDWDALDRLVGKSYPGTEHAAVTYAYSGAQEGFSSRTDGLGEAKREYDSLGRLVAETDAAGRCIGYTWDDAGRLSVLEYPDGSKVRYSYDGAGNLVGADAPDGAYAYSYDGEGRPTALRRPDGTATEWEYDAEGNVLRADTRTASGTALASFAYSWDGEGNPVGEESAVLQPDGSVERRSRAYAYDAAGRLASFEERDGSGALAVRESYGWDAAGNRTAIARTAGENPGQVLFGYDEANRLVSRTGSDGSATYAYDGAGRLASVSEEGQEERTFSYGAEGRLAAVRQGGRVLLAAVWDGDGNKALQATLYHTDETELLPAEAAPSLAGQRPAPDKSGTPVSIVGQRFISASAATKTGGGHAADAAAALGGSARSDAATTAPNGAATAHEAAGAKAPWPLALLLAPNPAAMERALAALLFGASGYDDSRDGAPAAPGSLAALLPQAGLTPAEAARAAGEAVLAEDVAAQRAMASGSAANAPPSASGSSGAPVPVESPYVQERWELAEYATASALSDLPQTLWRSSSATGASENLIYGEGQSPLASLPSAAISGASSASVIAGASATGASLWLADSAMTGSALPAASGGSSYVADGLGSIASVLSGGSVSAAYSYTPWGGASGAGELPFFGYNSQEHAGGGTGLQYLRARFYDAASAAFPTADSYLGDPSDPSTLNRYAYCGGNPVAFSDPSGNERFSSQKQRNSWLKNNSAAAKKKQAAAPRKPAPQSKALAPNGSLGARNLIFKAKDTPLYSAKVNKALPPATRAPVLNRSQDTWRGAVVKAGGVSQITYSHKSSADYATDGSYGTGSGGGLFGAVGDFFSGAVSYASRQVQAVRDHVCGAAEHIADQLGFDLPDLSDVAHGALDIIGFWPGVGVGADILNGFLYAAEGNWGDAAASFVGALPVLGDGIKAGYMGVKAGKGLGKVAGAFLAADIVDLAQTGRRAAGSSSVAVRSVDEFVDLASSESRDHVLKGHSSSSRKSKKTKFPKTWSDDKIMHEVSDIVTDPDLTWNFQKIDRGKAIFEVHGTRDGVEIIVITDGKDIKTAYPHSKE